MNTTIKKGLIFLLKVWAIGFAIGFVGGVGLALSGYTGTLGVVV